MLEMFISVNMPAWWDGTQSVKDDAFMLTRHDEYLLGTAEKFLTINKLLLPSYDYPQTSINNVWQE